MIPVRWRQDELDKKWDRVAAQKHTNELRVCATAEERSAYLDSHPLWRSVSALLKRWSYRKCWYTEAKTEQHGGRFEVDHFRPKCEARDPWNGNRTWDGYWWLAYDPTNFRLSATSANTVGRDADGNTSGKGACFPLRAPTVAIATCRAELDDETRDVMLIDPLDADAVADVSFREDGRVTCTSSDDELRSKRVELTVNVYNLDKEALIEARRDVWRECKSLVDKIEKKQHLLKSVASIPDVARSIEADITELRNELKLKQRADAEYAGTALAFARSRGVAWVMALGQNLAPPELPPLDDEAPANDTTEAPKPSRYEDPQLSFGFVAEEVVKTIERPTKASSKAKATASAAKGKRAKSP